MKKILKQLQKIFINAEKFRGEVSGTGPSVRTASIEDLDKGKKVLKSNGIKTSYS